MLSVTLRLFESAVNRHLLTRCGGDSACHLCHFALDNEIVAGRGGDCLAFAVLGDLGNREGIDREVVGHSDGGLAIIDLNRVGGTLDCADFVRIAEHLDGFGSCCTAELDFVSLDAHVIDVTLRYIATKHQ